MTDKKIDLNKKWIELPYINIKLLCGLLLTGFIIHAYRLTQMINNHDDMGNLYKTYGAGTTSGRWALSLFGDYINNHLFLGSFNLPLFNGMITVAFLALSVCIILEMFSIQNSFAGYIFGVLFISYPTCAVTLLYMYTASFYGFSCLLAVSSVYLWKQHKLPAWILGIIASSFAVGIYQAYFPIIACLTLMVYIVYVLENEKSFIENIKMALYYVISLILSLASYYIILMLILKVKGIQLSSYQGISEMGTQSIKELVKACLKTYYIFGRLIKQNYHSINSLWIVKYCIGILLLVIFCEAIYLIIRKKGFMNKIILGGSIFLFPMGVNLIEVMCSKSYIYELMIYATAFIYLLPIVLHEQIKSDLKIKRFCKVSIDRIVLITLVIVSLSYIWVDNWNYVALNFLNKKAESYMTTVVTSIKMTEGYKDDRPILFIGEGKIDDLEWYNPYADYPEFFFQGTDRGNLMNAYSWKEGMVAYTGFTYVPAGDDIYENAESMNIIKEMPCYPDYGSIRVIDDIMVVKFSEE